MNGSLLKQVANIQAVTLVDHPDHLVIDPKFKSTKIASKLVLDKGSEKIREVESNAPLPQGDSAPVSTVFSVFLGMISIEDVSFLLFGKEVLLCAQLDRHDVFMLKSVQFVSCRFSREELRRLPGYGRVKEVIGQVKAILSRGHYFSYTYDLTQTSPGQEKPSRESFVYNHLQLQPLRSFSAKWAVQLVQGFVDQFEIYLNGKKLLYTLISRKSRKMAGTRFHSRGLDQEGNVANYVETEQLVLYMSHFFSFLSLRGSVPLFWKQTGLTNQSIKISGHPSSAAPSFNAHLAKVLGEYGYVILLDLMQKSRHIEHTLSSQFGLMVRQHNAWQDKVRYLHFDYHQHHRKQSVNSLFETLAPQLDNFGFYGLNQPDQEEVLLQRGVLRLNCLDCLDRTNVVQSKLCCYTLQQQLECLQCDLRFLLKQHLHVLIDQPTHLDPSSHHPLVKNLQKIWADNGDYLSQHYAGTDSTMSSLTRHGGRPNWSDILSIGIKNIERFYASKYLDSQKQEAIDTLLGDGLETRVQPMGQAEVEKETIGVEVLVRQGAQSSVQQVQGKQMSVVGVECELEEVEGVLQDLQGQLDTLHPGQYSLVGRHQQEEGDQVLVVLLFCPESIQKRVSQVSGSSSPGAAVLSVSLDTTVLSFSMVRLPEENKKEAGGMLDSLYLLTSDSDYQVIMGDMQCHLEPGVDRHSPVETLRQADQWLSFHYYSQVAQIMQEPPVSFPPNGVYLEQPYYSLRVFVISKVPYKMLSYDSLSSSLSPHKPVLALFSLQVQRVFPPQLDFQQQLVQELQREQEDDF